jgi:hypothetical protein
LFPSTQTPNHLVWTLSWGRKEKKGKKKNILPPSSESLLKTQAVYHSETLLPREQNINTMPFIG